MTSLTIVGGGIGGLAAAIAAAQQGVGVTLHEAKDRLGGRAWTTDGDFKANWGPHVIYGDGTWWPWLKERGLGEPAFRFPRLPKTAYRVDGRGQRFPALGLLRSLAKVRRRSAPVDRSFQDWAADQVGDEHAHARSRVEHSTGALDMPGTTWQDRPQVDRGGGIYLVGDMVAVPGLLAEVSFNAALAAVAAVTASTDDLVSRVSRRRGLETAAGDVATAPAR